MTSVIERFSRNLWKFHKNSFLYFFRSKFKTSPASKGSAHRTFITVEILISIIFRPNFWEKYENFQNIFQTWKYLELQFSISIKTFEYFFTLWAHSRNHLRGGLIISLSLVDIEANCSNLIKRFLALTQNCQFDKS